MVQQLPSDIIYPESDGQPMADNSEGEGAIALALV